MRPVHERARESYSCGMNDEKAVAAKREAVRIINKWAEGVMALRGWSAMEWAKRAKISPTTITRGMKADAQSTTKIENIHALAVAARVPSVLEFLETGATEPPRPEQLSEDTWTALLAFAFDADMEDRVQLERIRIAADIVRHGLGLIEEDQDFERNPKMLVAALKRFAATRHADTRQSPPA